jgi:hypothetical protein
MSARTAAAAGVCASLMFLTGACSGTMPTAEPASSPAMPVVGAPRTATTTPSGEFPVALSTTTADSRRTVTTTELSGELIAKPIDKPDGFRGVTVIVDVGLGSFALATPTSYSEPWRVGTPADQLVAEGAARDPAWAEQMRSIAASAKPDGGLRAVLIDTAPTDSVTALVVTVSRGAGRSGEQLAEEMRQGFTDTDRSVDEVHPVTVNGAEGAYAEFSIDPRPGSTERRVGMQVRVPDPPNNLLWGITCEVPDTRRAELEPVCAQIAATFRPLPRIGN